MMVQIEYMTYEQLKEWYEWFTSDNYVEIPKYNAPDWDNDSIDVLRAKVIALSRGGKKK